MGVTVILKGGLFKLSTNKQMAINEFVIKIDGVVVELGKKEERILYLEEQWEWVIIRHPNLQKTVSFKTLKGGHYLSLFLASEVYKQLDDLTRPLTIKDLYTLLITVPITLDGRVDSHEIRNRAQQIKEGIDCI